MTTTVAPLPTLRTVLRPVAADDVLTLQAIRRSPEVARWCRRLDPARTDRPESATPLTVELSGARDIGPDGAVIGLVVVDEGGDPDRASATVELFLAASVHRRGLGREVVAAVLGWLAERGQHRVTADPATANDAAIACFRSCGFHPVGVLHAYERDADGRGWHDNLLLEWVLHRRA